MGNIFYVQYTESKSHKQIMEYVSGQPDAYIVTVS
jgi:hypothetical protein